MYLTTGGNKYFNVMTQWTKYNSVNVKQQHVTLCLAVEWCEYHQQFKKKM